MKEMRERRTGRQATVWLCTTAILMAMNIAVCPASVPVPGGHFYLNDIIICTAASSWIRWRRSWSAASAPFWEI